MKAIPIQSRLALLLAAFVLLDGCHSQPPASSPPPPSAVPDANFVDVARQAGLNYQWVIPGPRPLNVLQIMGSGCAFLDYNNDGNLDVLLVGSKLALYKGDGKGHFTDVTHAMGLDRLHGHFLGCAVGDYDNDGYDDVYVSGWHTGLLLQNEKGKGFKDVTRRAGLGPQPWGTSAAWGDIDGDGRLDLYVCNYINFGPDVKPQMCSQIGMDGKTSVQTACGPEFYKAVRGVLYRNEGAGKFRDVTNGWGADSVNGKALAAAFCDFNGSGRQSLYIANDKMPGDFLMNQGQSFINNGVKSGTAFPLHDYRAGMGVDWGDFNNDGRLDLTVSDFYGEQKCVLYNAGDGSFEEHSYGLGLAAPAFPYLSFGVKWFDYDNDGWLDLMFVNGYIMDNAEIARGDKYRETSLLFHNDSGRHFTDMSARAGRALQKPIVGRGLAIGDFDNDGRVDALVVDSEGPPLLLHNESKSTGHWLSFTLVGDGVRCNRDGYGAQVVVTAGGLTQTRLCHADGSYLSSSDKRVHVGLGKASRAEAVTVRWPGGRVDSFKGVAGDRGYVVREGDKALDTRPQRPL